MASASIETFYAWGRKIVAIGRNYADHAKELGNAVPSRPFFFLKPTSSYLRMPGNIELPVGTEVHHEVELGVVIGETGRDLTTGKAMDHVAGYVLAIDLTARDLQAKAKKEGKPWSEAKGFDTFTPVRWVQAHDSELQLIRDPHALELYLRVDGAERQRGPTSDMLFPVPELLAHVSSVMRLERGDLLLTGTPAGVGPLAPGCLIEAGVRGLPGSSTSTSGDLAALMFRTITRPGTGAYGADRVKA
ncbi:hypothetical protein HK405_007171 [Cladochytrium tenue]|nr:hypothetical protein HK405_007171 [Cladochytrium tenue]